MLILCVCSVLLLAIYRFSDNLNCLHSVTQQKEAVSFLKSELNLAQQLQQRQAKQLAKTQQELHNVTSLQRQKDIRDNFPIIYMITPTHSCLTQKADLTRLCHTLMHVTNLHWIVVEDSVEKTSLVTRFLARCTVQSTHLNIRTDPNLQLKPNDPNWLRNRGVEQRNLAIDWLRQHLDGETTGVVYFGDDDNTYDLQLFEEMRYTRKVSVWPVGICGGLRFEGPVCADGRVTCWHTAWEVNRPFPLDMAGFAVGLPLLLARKGARMNQYAKRGFVESSLLSNLINGIDELEPKADDCSKVWVWHTRTEKPKMTQEERLIKEGKPSNPKIET